MPNGITGTEKEGASYSDDMHADIVIVFMGTGAGWTNIGLLLNGVCMTQCEIPE